MIYTAYGYWMQYGSTKPIWAQYPLWQAHYTPSTFQVCAPWAAETFLQWSERGKGSDYGVPTSGERGIDMNYFHGTLKELYAFCNRSLVGGNQPPVVPPPPVVEPVLLIVQPLFSNVNRRTGPGVTYPSAGFWDAGRAYDVVQIMGMWARVEGPTREWVHLDYARQTPVTSTTSNQTIIKIVKTSLTYLRIRSLPSTAGQILGFLTKDKPYGIVTVQGDWGRLEGATERWVHLGYTVVA